MTKFFKKAKDLNKPFTKVALWVASKHVKRWSAIWPQGMQMSSRRHHYRLGEAEINGTNSTKCWRSCREIGSLTHC